MKSILLIKKLLGLVEMISVLVNASFMQLARMASCKNDFLCTLTWPSSLFMLLSNFLKYRGGCGHSGKRASM